MKNNIRARVTSRRVVILTAVFSVAAIAFLGTRKSEMLRQLIRAGSTVGYSSQSINYTGPFGASVVRRDGQSRLDAPPQLGTSNRVSGLVRGSSPVLIDVPNPSAESLLSLSKLPNLVQISSTSSVDNRTPVLADFKLSRSRDTLRVLRLSSTPHKYDSEFVGSLSEFSQLEVIWLPRCQCSDDAIERLITLPHLRTLGVDGAEITDRCWTFLHTMSALEIIALGPNVNVDKDDAKRFVDTANRDIAVFVHGEWHRNYESRKSVPQMDQIRFGERKSPDTESPEATPGNSSGDTPLL